MVDHVLPSAGPWFQTIQLAIVLCNVVMLSRCVPVVLAQADPGISDPAPRSLEEAGGKP